MNLARLKVKDLNGQFGSFAIPAVADIQPDDVIEFAEKYRLLSMTGIVAGSIVLGAEVEETDASGGATSLITDIAVLGFQSSGPFGLKLAVFGPGPIFNDDNFTVDEENEDVMSFVEWMVDFALDSQGNPLTAFLGGYRLGGS